MNNKKYPRYALFAMMLLGIAQQTLPMAPNLTKTLCRIIPSVPKKLNFRSFIKRNSKTINNLKKRIISLYSDKVFYPKMKRHLATTASKIAKIGPLKMVGEHIAVALTVASTAASGIYYGVINKRGKTIKNGKPKLSSGLIKYKLAAIAAAAADSMFYPKMSLAKIVPKIAPKIPMGFLRIMGGPISASLTVASIIYYLAKGAKSLAKSQEKSQNIIESKYSEYPVAKVAGALIGVAAVATPAVYWVTGKIRTLIANAKQKQQAETEEAKEIERTIARAANMSVPELQAFLKSA